MTQFTLGDLISRLENVEDQDKMVFFDFCGCIPTVINSSRGFYRDPALGWSGTGYSSAGSAYSNSSVSALVERLKWSLGRTYTGWKGGEYTYDTNSRLWVDNPGDWNSTYITEVSESYVVVLRTYYDSLV